MSGYLSDLLPSIMEGLRAESKKQQYFDDPVLWAWDILGVRLWEKQEEIAYDIARGDKKAVAVRAGHGVGKSFLSAVLVCWWIDTRPLNRVFVATTAPSADQVSAILWREIRGLWALSHERYSKYKDRLKNGLSVDDLPDHPLPGYITGRNEWKNDVGVLVAQGRKPPDHKEDAFQGIHAEYVLAIGDEAVGLNTNMIDSLSNITTNEKSRRLLIANPTNPNSRLGEIFSDKIEEYKDKITNETKTRRISDAWSLHHISVLDSPNFHGGHYCKCPEHVGMTLGLGMPRDALSALTGPSYVEEKKIEYGEDSARYKSRVLGEFAYDEGNNLFEEWVIAKARDATCFVPDDARRVLGVDVARSKHGDSTFVYLLESGLMYEWIETKHDDEHVTSELGEVTDVEGARVRFVDSFRGVPIVDRYEQNGEETIGQATLIHQHAVALGVSEIRVDAGGLGGGLIDALMGMKHRRYAVVEMIGGGATPDKVKWYNNRAFQFDQMRDRMEKGLIDIDSSDTLLIEQLGDILYENRDPFGAKLIESKDSMKKRGVKSPDAADACWYACADISGLVDNPYAGAKKGDTYFRSPWEMLNAARTGSGMPI